MSCQLGRVAEALLHWADHLRAEEDQLKRRAGTSQRCSQMLNKTSLGNSHAL